VIYINIHIFILNCYLFFNAMNRYFSTR